MTRLSSVQNICLRKRFICTIGIPGWLNVMLHLPTGSLAKSDLDQLAAECDRYRKIRFSMGYYLHNPLGN
ncbi:hypothetical protein [Coleofasciculus sp. FACHB-SPT36]|uniref:hypothetical protein n=1 Tax=Cyanophyceae TaxID=3028117 RepID=UPI0019C484A1|nr:hypothetical protein [Coleofasciculus sp. FACHB-SPT36]MBD2539442.1 hypothetical protein [Coleofasciculus sp. FACHB-SPT36]